MRSIVNPSPHLCTPAQQNRRSIVSQVGEREGDGVSARKVADLIRNECGYLSLSTNNAREGEGRQN
jgi:hypothetical protein